MIDVLIVDDDDALRAELKRGLKDAGLSVAGASNGIDGLERYKQTDPHIVLTDVYMDDGDGIELIQNIREISERIPIFAMCGNAKILRMVEKTGATDTLTKPFKIRQLLDMIAPA